VVPTDCYNVVSFTNHQVHPGEPSVFDDISIQGVFCSKSVAGMPTAADGAPGSQLAQIWIDAHAVVSNLIARDYHRSESLLPSDDLHIESGVTAENVITASDGVRYTSLC